MQAPPWIAEHCQYPLEAISYQLEVSPVSPPILYPYLLTTIYALHVSMDPPNLLPGFWTLQWVMSQSLSFLYLFLVLSELIQFCDFVYNSHTDNRTMNLSLELQTFMYNCLYTSPHGCVTDISNLPCFRTPRNCSTSRVCILGCDNLIFPVQTSEV